MVEQIGVLVQDSRQQLSYTINTTIAFTYWHIGKYIVEFEQKGEKRAEYGMALLKNLSKDLTEQLGKSFSYRNLQLFKKFYNTFPIMQSVIAQSENKNEKIVHTLYAQSENNDEKEIWHTPCAKLQKYI